MSNIGFSKPQAYKSINSSSFLQETLSKDVPNEETFVSKILKLLQIL